MIYSHIAMFLRSKRTEQILHLLDIMQIIISILRPVQKTSGQTREGGVNEMYGHAAY